MQSKPVSRVLSWTVIHLGCMSPYTSSNPPESKLGLTIWIPIWSCSERGLPCHSCYQLRGALLPHHFTLTTMWRYNFCGTFRRLAPPRYYLAFCPMEPGLSSLSLERLPSLLCMHRIQMYPTTFKLFASLATLMGKINFKN